MTQKILLDQQPMYAIELEDPHERNGEVLLGNKLCARWLEGAGWLLSPDSYNAPWTVKVPLTRTARSNAAHEGGRLNILLCAFRDNGNVLYEVSAQESRVGSSFGHTGPFTFDELKNKHKKKINEALSHPPDSDSVAYMDNNDLLWLQLRAAVPQTVYQRDKKDKRRPVPCRLLVAQWAGEGQPKTVLAATKVFYFVQLNTTADGQRRRIDDEFILSRVVVVLVKLLGRSIVWRPRHHHHHHHTNVPSFPGPLSASFRDTLPIHV
ncbi:unnamed protein product [Vitrella brassicaformis CCMP3155]|uniref:Uncharacterized protein n=1 Tax=Vitrella brassicaformis (strain CCMP3155) TaxID=1169540 RepID=A0A0G4ELX2_VITBC|nr:unnamed protein product [Vitrella brassicaformis CCMP3155]|eukprot:CEL97967.1 unnamed protein product [Vitrella brassicaformis CCMP3155]